MARLRICSGYRSGPWPIIDCILNGVKVFISWSGEASHQVAKTLRDWVPQVLQSVEPWLASSELISGQPVAKSIEGSITSADVVLLCLTRQNMLSNWTKIESAVALNAKRPIIPVCIDFPVSDLSGMFAMYQGMTLDEAGIHRLMTALNSRLTDPMESHKLDRLLGIWMPEIFRDLAKNTAGANFTGEGTLKLIGQKQGPPVEDLMQKILREVQSLAAKVAEIGSSTATATPEMPTETAAEPTQPTAMDRPRIFIGSSVEGLPIAEHIQARLDYAAECTVWDQDVFRPSETAIESLIERSASFDCAVIVLTADDVVTKRDNTAAVPRDNLIFELGLFTGSLGRAKTFMVVCRDDEIELPTDLNGVTALQYPRRSDGNIGAAVAPACLRIKEVMGLR